ncbi:HigA family addiction module antitoxin [Saccharopolyspora indica]|nr:MULTISPECIES: HigA family addiction module antitoxin [Saccharopolyspora]MDA3644663.1 HigA family addiction module antitoxin [Saccharopolyspora indica]
MNMDIVMPPVHPGVILREEFLEPMGITEYRLAKDLGIPQTRVSAITHGRRGITADTGLRLSRYFSMSEGFWTGLQDDYDRAIAKDKLGDALDSITPISA